MNNYPACSDEVRMALQWMEQAGEDFRLLRFDAPTNQAFVDRRSPDTGIFAQWVVFVDDEGMPRRKLVGRMGKGLPIRNKHVDEATTKKVVKNVRSGRRTRQNGAVKESLPYSSFTSDKWKERSDMVRKVREQEDLFLKNPNDNNFQLLKVLRLVLIDIEDELVAMEEERMEDAVAR